MNLLEKLPNEPFRKRFPKLKVTKREENKKTE